MSILGIGKSIYKGPEVGGGLVNLKKCGKKTESEIGLERQAGTRSCKAFRVVVKNLGFIINAFHWKPPKGFKKKIDVMMIMRSN